MQKRLKIPRYIKEICNNRNELLLTHIVKRCILYLSGYSKESL